MANGIWIRKVGESNAHFIETNDSYSVEAQKGQALTQYSISNLGKVTEDILELSFDEKHFEEIPTEDIRGLLTKYLEESKSK